MATPVISRAVPLPPTTAIADAGARNFCNAISLRLSDIQQALSTLAAASSATDTSVTSALVSDVQRRLTILERQVVSQASSIALLQLQVAELLSATGLTLEDVDDRVAALLQAGTNITLTYDDPANTLTINSVGGGGDAILTESEEAILSESGDFVLTE